MLGLLGKGCGTVRDKMRWFWSFVLVLLLGATGPAFADEDFPLGESSPDASGEGDTTSAPASPKGFYPPNIDYPPLQGLGTSSSLYVDQTFESTNDLSTLPWVKGRGRNYRLAVGGQYQLDGLRLNAEVPVQYTQLSIDTLMGVEPADSDRSKSVISLGDIATGAAYLWDLPIQAAKTNLGLGLRVRLPTHTTKYKFGLQGGGTVEFGIPYYLHLAPGVLFSTHMGPVSLSLSEGVLAMLARDVWIGDLLQPIPNLYFWESHVAADVAATDWLDISVEVLSCVQLGQVTVSNMTDLNGTRAVFINPGVTVDFGNYRLALAGRFGMPGRSSRDFGVITFSGSNAYLARLSYVF
jgi:hypothetical protein